MHQLTPNQYAFRMFKHFLVNNHAYMPFIQNLKETYDKATIPRLGYPGDWIFLAFCWISTPQTYWARLHGEWDYLYNESFSNEAIYI